MEVQEFSLEFDLLYNNIFSDKAPGLNEYEKSLFLTEAQEAVVLSLYNGNAELGNGFESTESVREYLSPLVRNVTLKTDVYGCGMDTRSVFFEVPEDVWFKTGEKAVISDSSLECNGCDKREVDVVPVTQDALYKTKNSPFRGPNNRRVLRLDSGPYTVELISNYPISSYTLRYLAKPDPIILDNLTDGLSINGKTNAQTCKLNPVLHRTILLKAVELAKAVWAA